jgi:hypothetical protein
MWLGSDTATGMSCQRTKKSALWIALRFVSSRLPVNVEAPLDIIWKSR